MFYIVVLDGRVGGKRPKPKDLPITLPDVWYVSTEGTIIYCVEYEGWYIPCVKTGINYTLCKPSRLKANFYRWLDEHYPHYKEVRGYV